jgi:hypothetical protein
VGNFLLGSLILASPGPTPSPETTAQARTKYQDFFALWKDAPDVPILKEAKAEYAKLR